MRADSKQIARALEVTEAESIAIDEGLFKLVHDVQGCLHIIGLGTELLKGARDDDAVFREVTDRIDRERGEAMRLLHQYLRSTRAS